MERKEGRKEGGREGRRSGGRGIAERKKRWKRRMEGGERLEKEGIRNQRHAVFIYEARKTMPTSLQPPF